MTLGNTYSMKEQVNILQYKFSNLFSNALVYGVGAESYQSYPSIVVYSLYV